MVVVTYWVGTSQRTGTAETYAEAMALADLNKNAYPPRFADETGKPLYDTGYGLAYEEPDSQGRIVCVV